MAAKILPTRVDVTSNKSRYGLYFVGGDAWIVTPVWPGVDRPTAGGYSCGPDKKLADRLAKAFMDGKAYGDTEIRKDVNGKTYVDFALSFLMRNADSALMKMGY